MGAFGWAATFLENRADSSQNGFRLDHLNGSILRGNTVIGARSAAILAEHGRDNTIEANVLVDARVGILVAAPRTGTAKSSGYRIDDNVVGGTEQGIVLQSTTGSRVRGNLFDGVRRRAAGGWDGPRDRSHRQRLPSGERMVHRRAGPGRGRKLLGDGGCRGRIGAGEGADQCSAVALRDGGGLLARISLAMA